MFWIMVTGAIDKKKRLIRMDRIDGVVQSQFTMGADADLVTQIYISDGFGDQSELQVKESIEQVLFMLNGGLNVEFTPEEN